MREEEEGTQNSECFIVEGHLTHYKWYDYKQEHTTYTKQLTNNTKQTDKTKRNRKRKQTQTKQQQQQQQKPQKKATTKKARKKKQQSILDVDNIQVLHANLSTATSG